MGHQMFNDPFTSSLSSLEEEIFSGGRHHLAPSPHWPGLDHDIPVAPAANNATSSGGSGSHRKMSHNAYERDSRKQLNEHYSNLRSLLPDDDHHTVIKSLNVTQLVHMCEILYRASDQFFFR
jgi:hypothetical protein